MHQKPPINQNSDEDKILWQRVTQRVKPLVSRQQKLLQRVQASPPPTALVGMASKAKETLPIAPKSSIPLVTPVDLRIGERAGLDGRTQKRLSRGDVPIDRRLDLHGHTATQAELKLKTFIEGVSHAGCRCVLVITGKGAGVLRSNVPRWLKESPLSGLVLALAEARPVDGGSGAFYVLLRRRR